jgi:N6-adenosine-specific RNA methylase IME4
MVIPETPGGWACILADPAWSFKTYTPLEEAEWKTRRDAGKHYQVMGIEDIMNLPVKDVAAKDAHLFLWVTGPNLPKAFFVMDAWGFRYSGVAFTWIKLKRKFEGLTFSEKDLHVGLGMTTRKNAEFCLLARRGSCRRLAKDVREVIISPVREHSRKPNAAYIRIERYCAGPRLELFGRQQRDGWTVWGDEANKYGP